MLKYRLNGTTEGSASYRGGRNQLDRRPSSTSRGPRAVGSDGQPRRNNLRSPRRARSGSVLLKSEVPLTPALGVHQAKALLWAAAKGTAAVGRAGDSNEGSMTRPARAR
jgi:hypothetical protein